jgi:hypothetical protein
MEALRPVVVVDFVLSRANGMVPVVGVYRQSRRERVHSSLDEQL